MFRLLRCREQIFELCQTGICFVDVVRRQTRFLQTSLRRNSFKAIFGHVTHWESQAIRETVHLCELRYLRSWSICEWDIMNQQHLPYLSGFIERRPVVSRSFLRFYDTG